jgi:hypothetical protein
MEEEKTNPHDIIELPSIQAAADVLKPLAIALPFDLNKQAVLTPGKHTRIIPIGTRKFFITFTYTIRLPQMVPYSLWQLSVTPVNSEEPRLEDSFLNELLRPFFNPIKRLGETSGGPLRTQRAFVQFDSMTHDEYILTHN